MKIWQRLIVFPVKERRWCIAMPSCESTVQGSHHSSTSFKQILTSDKDLSSKAELLSDYFSQKMHQKWLALEKASTGTIRHKVYRVGSSLLDRLKPSETFFKSIPKETSKLEVVFPLSLNPRLVRRRLRCMAVSGAMYHRRYMYISVALLPFTALLAVLPFPNVFLFWNLFRAHSHWRALQGSERLILLVSDCPHAWSQFRISDDKAIQLMHGPISECPWVLCPSEELENFVSSEAKEGGLSNSAIESISKTYNLDTSYILKWRDYKKDL